MPTARVDTHGLCVRLYTAYAASWNKVACSARLYLFLYHLRGELVLVGAQSPRGHQRVAFDEHGHGGRCDQRD